MDLTPICPNFGSKRQGQYHGRVVGMGQALGKPQGEKWWGIKGMWVTSPPCRTAESFFDWPVLCVPVPSAHGRQHHPASTGPEEHHGSIQHLRLHHPRHRCPPGTAPPSPFLFPCSATHCPSSNSVQTFRSLQTRSTRSNFGPLMRYPWHTWNCLSMHIFCDPPIY